MLRIIWLGILPGVKIAHVHFPNDKFKFKSSFVFVRGREGRRRERKRERGREEGRGKKRKKERKEEVRGVEEGRKKPRRKIRKNGMKFIF